MSTESENSTPKEEKPVEESEDFEKFIESYQDDYDEVEIDW
jgi:hypothetical protein